MLERIFLLVLAICAAIATTLTYYSWSWLQSIGAPTAAVDGYMYHSGFSWIFLLVSSIALLAFANFILAYSERSWPIWVAFVYFAVFVLIRYFFLERAFFHFRVENGLADATISWAPFAGAVIVVVAGAVVFANQLLVVRLRERMYPKQESPEIEDEAGVENSESGLGSNGPDDGS